MADLTVHAEALIATVARAMYDDECICLIDVLIRDKYLRDDDMAKRLQLPAKRLRATLQFLTEEHLVSYEMVDDLAEGGSQATKFYYIDYNRAVHSIRLRVHLLRKKLEHQELRARSSSFYLCPGYDKKRCNGRYTEEEAQMVLNEDTGLFLCQECSGLFENDPNPPPLEEYTLQLVDNEKDLKLAMDNMRRLNVQLSGKMIGNHQLRSSVYDLLQKVRTYRKAPITSNLPSENFALEIGSKRIAGTGRTNTIKVNKMQKEGLAESAAQAQDLLVSGGRRSGSATDGGDLMFLKSAHGHEIKLKIERGAGSRAQLLARQKLKTRKLMEAAASRVGASLPIPIRVQENLKRKAEAEAKAAAQDAKQKKMKITSGTLEFLKDNIGRSAHERTDAEEVDDWDAEENTDDDEEANGDNERDLLLSDDMEEWVQLTEESRMAKFQAQYKLEMARQAKLLQLEGSASPSRLENDDGIPWEDGQLD